MTDARDGREGVWSAPATERLDDRLVQAAADGDTRAFDQLIRPRLDRLFRLAVAILRSEADARDVVQDGCVQAWRELPRLRDRDRFDAWVSQIIVNGCRSHLRRHRRAEVREIDMASMVGAELDPALQSSDRAGDLSEAQAIQRAFGRLDGPTRSLLVLHYVEERPLADIAATMASPVGTIKWRLSKAREALGRALEAERR